MHTAADDVTKPVQDAQFSEVQPTFSISHGDTVVIAMISQPILIRSSQLFYIPYQLFLRRPPTL